MLNIGLKVSSWRYKQSLKRSASINGKSAQQSTANNRVAPNASFLDGVATKDCTIDLTSSLSVRIFLPYHCLGSVDAGFGWLPQGSDDQNADPRSNFGDDGSSVGSSNGSYDGSDKQQLEDVLRFTGGYHPRKDVTKLLRLPVVVEFHDGGFVSGSKDSVSNDAFCRRIAKACKSVVVAVGYRLAPRAKYPAARDDGIVALAWLAKQANLAEFSSSKAVSHGIFDSLGHDLVDPWVSAHVDFSRCFLMGIGAGGTIADQVARSVGSLKLEPLKVIGQVLLCPLFGGPTALQSEIDLASAYFMDRETLSLAWRSLLPEGENISDHPAINPLRSKLSGMPSTLVISAEHDMLRDRAAVYVESLKISRVDASLVIYRNAVHGFATMDFCINTKLAQACVEDMAIWLAKRCNYLECKRA